MLIDIIGWGIIIPVIPSLIKELIQSFGDRSESLIADIITCMNTPSASQQKAAFLVLRSVGVVPVSMHNKIYESQSDWENLSGTERADFFTNYAKSLKLDTAKFNTDVASSAIGDKLDYDKALGVKAGVDATPTFYLNGTKLDSDVWGDEAKLKDAINTELKKAGIELPASEK